MRNTEYKIALSDCPPFPQGVTILHVPGFPGYAVGDDGIVRSCRPCKNLGNVRKWRKLKPGSRSGYRFVILWKNRVQYAAPIGRLVAEVFHGKCPRGMELRHLDGDKTNDLAANVTWGTHRENMQDAIRHGTSHCLHQRGEQNPSAKLNWELVAEIRRLWPRLRNCQLSRMFSMSETTIHNVVNRITWVEKQQ